MLNCCMASMTPSSVTPRSCKRFSISELTYSPCLTLAGYVCRNRMRLIEMKDFLKNRGETGSRLSFANENIAHLGLPARAGLAGRHDLQVALEIIDLHVGEKLRAAQVDGVVLAPGTLEVCQEFRPDLPVAPSILFLCAWLDLHRKSDALHYTPSIYELMARGHAEKWPSLHAS